MGDHMVGGDALEDSYEFVEAQAIAEAAMAIRLPKATKCMVSGSHRPTPSRYVHHHVWPVGLGGPNEPDNIIEACDNCHYGVHTLLTHMLAGTVGDTITSYPFGVRKYARMGYYAVTNGGMHR